MAGSSQHIHGSWADNEEMDVDANRKRGRENLALELANSHKVSLTGSPTRALTTAAKRTAFTVQHTVEVLEAGSNRRLSFARRTLEGGVLTEIDQWKLGGYPNAADLVDANEHNGILLLQGASSDAERRSNYPSGNAVPGGHFSGMQMPSSPPEGIDPADVVHGNVPEPGNVPIAPWAAWSNPGRIQSLHRQAAGTQHEYTEEDLKQRAGNPYLQKISPDMGNQVTEEDMWRAFEATEEVEEVEEVSPEVDVVMGGAEAVRDPEQSQQTPVNPSTKDSASGTGVQNHGTGSGSSPTEELTLSTAGVLVTVSPLDLDLNKDPHHRNILYAGKGYSTDISSGVATYSSLPEVAQIGWRVPEGATKPNWSSGRLAEQTKRFTERWTTIAYPIEVMLDTLKFISWNVRGLTEASRAERVKSWVRRKHKDAMAICLQEVKNSEERLESQLTSIIPGATVVADLNSEARGGTAIVLTPGVQILNTGTKGDGSCAWATIMTARGPTTIYSFYAPGTPRDRRRLWSWMADTLPESQAIITGDFNMVEYPEDSKGPTAVLKGDELQKWSELSVSWDLIDCWLCAAERSGPWYTRRAKRGNRIDLARLDRVYMTRGGDWTEYVKRMEHVGGKTLSDHIPVVATIKLLQGEPEVRKTTYFKLDYRILDSETVFREAKRTWNDHPREEVDPRVKWILAWRRLKGLFKRVQREQCEKYRELEKKEAELQTLKTMADFDHSEELASEIEILEAEVRSKETWEVTQWRNRSRNRWLKEGEAPSKYFFSQLKTKHQRESIKALQRESGEMITSERGIIGEIEQFYSELYLKDDRVERNIAARDNLLAYVNTTVSPQQNDELIGEPSMEELEEVVKRLPSEKAPGLDGATAEILVRCWAFMKDDCLAMLVSYWQDGVLAMCDSRGVIKLLPKNQERQRLRNWRPITLLTLTYKLISKTLAGRMKKILPDLVDEHQTGFVDGRSIHESILLHRLSHEYADSTQQEAILLKLDFEKAYDRASHAYLEAVLRKMEFQDHFIRLVMGLLHLGTAKVHTNGMFTNEIQLGRGVRQGCPIAPFLFAICTEPLMALLRTHQQAGRLEGIKLPGGKQALYNLFADDTELSIKATEGNYQLIKELLQLYEEASGAKLNVRKSVMIPVSLAEIPLWMSRSGCRIAGKGEVVLHLGFPGGDSIREAQICKYLQDKITARTSSWANRWLSWGGRIILVQKILPMLPAYVLMTMGLSKRSYQEMERMWRTFIWGTREDGKAKKSSVAWDIMQQKKEQGGMQILDLGTHSDAVKIRQVAYILNGGQSAWTDIARAFTLKELATGRQRTERRRWTVEEALILGPRLIMKESPTFKQLLHPWYKVRDSLTFVARHGQLPASLTIGQVLTIATKKSGVHLQNEIQLRKFLKSARVDTLADLHPNQTPWQRLQTVILRVEATTALGQDIARLLEWIGQVEITQIPLQQCAGWTWSVRSSNTNRVGWVHETKWWKSILHGVTASAMKLNTKWSVGLDEQSWKQVWTTVWKKPSTTREGFWWWRTLWKGFWNGEQALKIGVSDGICPRCRAGIESVDHLFWSCSRSKNRWDLLKRVTVSTRNDMRHVNEWFDFKILALRLKNTDATLWAIAAELYRVLWRERNDLVFRGKRSIRPLREVVHETSRSVSAWITKSMPDRHKTLAVNTLETLLHLEIRLEPQAHPPNLVSTLHDSHEDLLQVNIDTQTWRPGELSL
ncbi:hypothetical protein R1sor_021092 [Riccia sorocarpa]|uniref:Reverse transcriptase domain-containing protein n=1 Tax=Riccia sorocarpa TaxID=122646 RepID=A0ABD3GHQ2_9MARC